MESVVEEVTFMFLQRAPIFSLVSNWKLPYMTPEVQVFSRIFDPSPFCLEPLTKMAGLSSNVMNMKFMQKAQQRDKKKEEEVQAKKVKDSSEWVLPNRAAVQKNVKSAVKVQTIGYGSIASMTTNKDDEKIEKDDDNELPKSESSKVCFSNLSHVLSTTNLQELNEQASKFLNSIMSKSSKEKKRNGKKRKGEGDDGQKKKKKTS